MAALHMQLHREGIAAVIVNLKAQRIPVLANIRCIHVQAVIGAEIENGLSGLLLQASQHGIVAIEHNPGIGCHALQDFHFGSADALLRAKMLHVHGADVENYRQIRAGNSGQIRHLPEVVHAHLHHCHLGVLRHSQNSHGHTDVIVVVGGGFGGAEGGFQHLRNHLFGGAFAHRAGNAHHLHSNAHPLPAGNFAQRQAGIGHIHGGVVPHHAGTQHGGSTARHGIGNKFVAVPRPLQRHKELAGLDVPGVVGCPVKHHVCVFFFHRTAAPFGGLTECNFTHVVPSILSGGLQPPPVHPDDA